MLKKIINEIKFQPFIVIFTFKNKKNDIKQILVKITKNKYKEYKKLLGLKDMTPQEFKILLLNNQKIKKMFEKKLQKKDYKLVAIDILD